MSSDTTLNILVEAKKEYTKQLTRIITPFLLEGIKSIYINAEQLTIENPNKLLVTFQTLLSRIPKWSNDIIFKEYNRIVVKSNCDWLDDLIMAVFISYTKVLTVVKVNGDKDKPIDLPIPKGSYFVHQCYIELARVLWNNPYLVHEESTTTCQNLREKNIRTLNCIIEKSVEDAIRNLLPIKNILKQYLGKDYIEENSSLTDITKDVSDAHYKNIERMVKKSNNEEKNLNNILLSEVNDSINKIDNLLKPSNNENIKMDFNKPKDYYREPIDDIGDYYKKQDSNSDDLDNENRLSNNKRDNENSDDSGVSVFIKQLNKINE